MRSKQSFAILLASASLLTLSSGCGTKHLAQQPGTAGFTLREVRTTVALPNENGEPVPGDVVLPAGTPFIVPTKLDIEKANALLRRPGTPTPSSARTK